MCSIALWLTVVTISEKKTVSLEGIVCWTVVMFRFMAERFAAVKPHTHILSLLGTTMGQLLLAKNVKENCTN